MALPDHFEGEDVIITFEKEWITGDTFTASTAIKNVEGKILSWNLSGGGQPTEDVYAFGNKTFNFSKPREKFSISFEAVINNNDFDFVNLGGESGMIMGSTNGKTIKSTDSAKRWRVTFWFQDSAYHVSNTAKTVIVPNSTYDIYRMMCVDVKSVSFDKEFSADDYFKGTLTLEFSAADSNGYANLIQEQGVGAVGTTTSLSDLTSGADMAEARGYLSWSATTTPSWTAGTTATRYRI